jgi:uncharacterized membrane protein YhdT
MSIKYHLCKKKVLPLRYSINTVSKNLAKGWTDIPKWHNMVALLHRAVLIGICSKMGF